MSTKSCGTWAAGAGRLRHFVERLRPTRLLAPADVQTHAPPCLCATLSRDSRSDGVQGPHERIGGRPGPEATKSLIRSNLQRQSGGEAGIRTLGRGLCPFNGLANRRLQPLGHLTASAVREPAGAGRNTNYTPMWPVVRPRPPRRPGTGHPPARHSITQRPACGPDRYSGAAPAVISVSSSRMIETA